MKYLKGGMQVDIQDLVASHQEIVSNPAQWYDVTDLHLECDVVSFEDSLEKSMNALIQQKGIDIHYES